MFWRILRVVAISTQVSIRIGRVEEEFRIAFRVSWKKTSDVYIYKSREGACVVWRHGILHQAPTTRKAREHAMKRRQQMMSVQPLQRQNNNMQENKQVSDEGRACTSFEWVPWSRGQIQSLGLQTVQIGVKSFNFPVFTNVSSIYIVSQRDIVTLLSLRVPQVTSCRVFLHLTLWMFNIINTTAMS